MSIASRSYGYRINEGYWSIRAPLDQPLYMVCPYRASNRLYYVLEYLPRGGHYVMRGNGAGGGGQANEPQDLHQSSTLFVSPTELPRVVRRLENAGITQFFPHLAKHPPFLSVHRKH